MTNRPPLLVVNVAGLSLDLLRSGGAPRLAAWAEAHGVRPLRPVFPALTLPVQATFLTGRPPAEHGIVGNGFFDRTYLEHRFWCASSGLLEVPPFWRRVNVRPVRVGALFWWNCLGAGPEVYLNVAPIHRADGSTLPSCASDPPDLYPELEARFGPFPLHRFWGPMVSIESTEWIVRATLHVMDRLRPEVLLTYLPHLDYCQQRSGPKGEETIRALDELDACMEEIIHRAERGEVRLLILSEYGIAPVHRPVLPNRLLRTAGLFRIRTAGGCTYPDLPGSRAFVICDHQVAHVYARDAAARAEAAEVLAAAEGVDRVLDEVGKAAFGMDHPRSGELVLLAAEDAWFAYPWWEEEEEAPDYAFTVDIHRKIGYDPLELILEPAAGRLASDPARIRGSHGLLPRREALHPVYIPPEPGPTKEDAGPMDAREVPGEILRILEARGSGG